MKIRILQLVALILLVTACDGNSAENIIEESGTVEATEVIISSKVAGTVIDFMREEGEEVNAGDTLVIIDQETLLIRKKLAEAAMASAKAMYDLLLNGSRSEDRKTAEEMLNISEVNYKSAEADKVRFEKLFSEKAVTKKQYEDITDRYEIAKANFNSAKANFSKINNIARPEELAQAKANFDQAVANLNLIEKNIQDCYVVSPSKGFIVKQFIEEGEMAATMSSICKITDLKKIELVIYVSETDLGKVKLGQKAEVFVDSFPEKAFTGVVSYISTEAEFTPKNIQTKDERTKLVFAVKIKVANPELELKPGMPADAKVFIN